MLRSLYRSWAANFYIWTAETGVQGPYLFNELGQFPKGTLATIQAVESVWRPKEHWQGTSRRLSFKNWVVIFSIAATVVAGFLLALAPELITPTLDKWAIGIGVGLILSLCIPSRPSWRQVPPDGFFAGLLGGPRPPDFSKRPQPRS